MIKAGIFDIGGVLLKWTNLPLFEDVDQTLLVTEEQRNEFWKKYMDQLEVGKITEKEFWQGFMHDTSATGVLPKESLLKREFKKRLTINADVLQIPLTLKTKGVPIAIISNTIQPHVEAMKEADLFKDFDVIILSNEVGYRKPGKEIYELTLQKLDVKAEETFFVDDLPENVEAANNIGIHGIQFLNELDLLNQINKLGVQL